MLFGWLDQNTCTIHPVQICIDCYQNAKATFGAGFNLAAPVAERILSGNKFAQIKKSVWWAAKSSISISHNLVCFQLVEVDNLLQTIETQNRSLLNPMHFHKMLHRKRNVLLCFAQIEQLFAHFWEDIFLMQ